MVSFSANAFESFLADNDDTPVVMLNLLEFANDGGKDRYFDYLRMAKPILARFGAQILSGGDGFAVLTSGQAKHWDAAVLVQYPNRAAFKAMVDDSEYQLAFKVGQSAIADIVLQPMRPNAQMM